MPRNDVKRETKTPRRHCERSEAIQKIVVQTIFFYRKVRKEIIVWTNKPQPKSPPEGDLGGLKNHSIHVIKQIIVQTKRLPIFEQPLFYL